MYLAAFMRTPTEVLKITFKCHPDKNLHLWIGLFVERLRNLDSTVLIGATLDLSDIRVTKIFFMLVSIFKTE